jgi:hypothetical protein
MYGPGADQLTDHRTSASAMYGSDQADHSYPQPALFGLSFGTWLGPSDVQSVA